MDPTEEQMNEPGYQVRLNDKGKWWSVNGIDWYPLTETFYAPIEADKELDELFSELAADFNRKQLDRTIKDMVMFDPNEAKTALLAWRDKAVVAELNEVLKAQNRWQTRTYIKARLSKLKAIMEIKE